MIAEDVDIKGFQTLVMAANQRFIQEWESFTPMTRVFGGNFSSSKQKVETLIVLVTKLISIRR